ncbi:MAG TPA: hypothetical protein VFV87_11415 [Pirellulaceae bacterium]|nr:hypothetical protein [Pirellulaceae bacterium]
MADHPRTRWRFSLAKLILVLTVYASVTAVVAALPVTQIAAALAVVTVFVAIDLGLGTQCLGGSTRVRLIVMTIAHYSTAFAYAGAACGFVYFWTLESQQIGNLPDPVLAVQGAFSELATLVVAFAFYWAVSTFFAAIGGIAALSSIRHSRRSVLLLMANVPWLVFFIYALASQSTE